MMVSISVCRRSIFPTVVFSSVFSLAISITSRVSLASTQELFAVLLKGAAAGRGFNAGKDVRQVGIQALLSARERITGSDRIAPVAAEGPAADAHPGGRLPTLVLVALDHLQNPDNGIAVEASGLDLRNR